jgi:hypothetical protein
MDTLAPLAILARSLAALPTYPDPMHHQDTDRLIAARLHAVATRGGWQRLEGDERAQTIAELQAIATVAEKPHRGALHTPATTLRTDMLGEVAGILLGSAPTDHPEKHLHGAELLREAGADEDAVQQWIPVGRERAASGGPAFSQPKPPKSGPANRRWP